MAVIHHKSVILRLLTLLQLILRFAAPVDPAPVDTKVADPDPDPVDTKVAAPVDADVVDADVVDGKTVDVGDGDSDSDSDASTTSDDIDSPDSKDFSFKRMMT